MPTMIKFNTGRLYTDQGQRIAAKLTDNGGLLFVDVDRGIDGYLHPEIVSLHHLTLTQHDVLWAYDNLSREWDCLEPHRRWEETRELHRYVQS